MMFVFVESNVLSDARRLEGHSMWKLVAMSHPSDVHMSAARQ